MVIFYAVERGLWHRPESWIWSVGYFQPSWQRVFDLSHSIPLALGGLGLREQVSALAFASLGTPAAVGPVFSLLWFLVVTVIPALIGLGLAQTRWGRAAGTLVERAPAADPDAVMTGGPDAR